jgi:23S rRNA (uridine2552-2'-O)-methyltransferase
LQLKKRPDKYSRKAKKEGYRSRAAYKLLQIDKKFNIFRSNQIIIDLCGAPGGFSQVARDQTHGKANIFLVDLSRVKHIPNLTEIIKGDITKLDTILKLRESVEKCELKDKDIVVLADCSPNVSGHWSTDHARQIWLAEVALGISNYFSAKMFISKVFQGEYFNEFLQKVKKSYSKVNVYKPPTSRKQSAETYIISKERNEVIRTIYNQNFLVLEE